MFLSLRAMIVSVMRTVRESASDGRHFLLLACVYLPEHFDRGNAARLRQVVIQVCRFVSVFVYAKAYVLPDSWSWDSM